MEASVNQDQRALLVFVWMVTLVRIVKRKLHFRVPPEPRCPLEGASFVPQGPIQLMVPHVCRVRRVQRRMPQLFRILVLLASGTYAPSTNAIACTSCPSCSQMGSFTQSAYSPVQQRANQTSITPEGSTAETPTPVFGWVFVGVLVGLMLLSKAIFVPLRHKTRRYLSAISVILRTAFNFLSVVPSSWTVIEIPSFYRGLVALWVIAGLILITAYQSDVFVTDGVTTDSSVQPGSQFTSGDPTSSATGNISLAIVLFQTPITCNSSQFPLLVVASGTTSTGSLSGPPDCVEDSSLSSLNLTCTFPSPLSFTSASSVSLQATSRMESPLFSHGVWYKILLENYDGTFTQIVETLTNDPSNQLTRDVSGSISNVPTEVLDENDETLKTGYLFRYFSSSAPALLFAPSSATLTVSFDLAVPEYFYQVKEEQSISGLQFVVGLVSLAGGVMAVGSVERMVAHSSTNTGR